LNFTFYYEEELHCYHRMEFFITKALKSCNDMPNPDFHATVIKGLLAMYLSDNKALTPQKKKYSLSLVRNAGSLVWLYYHWCRILRATKVL
jgi:tetraprenyl-beta-curcumene synthase